jgi:hypothetical protein
MDSSSFKSVDTEILHSMELEHCWELFHVIFWLQIVEVVEFGTMYCF